MDIKELADKLLPGITKTVEDIEKMYPKRELKEGAMVTRFAPSPTGFVHMGSLYVSYLARIYANQSEGVCMLRIEDTDGKRTVENAIEGIVSDLANFKITFDEGPGFGGEYGPYIQSERKEIYQAYAKMLIEKGLAYPCFCTEGDMENMRHEQELNKGRTGYYGSYAKCRNLTISDIEEKLANGERYIIRMRSKGSFRNRVTIKDEIRGKVSFPENDTDVVIIKADGLPTYHFAHVVDDHLMGTTHVIRGDEWLPSFPLHVQMFETMGWELPKFIHISPIGKMDEGSKRKLSKRKDPECAVSYYHEHGIPNEVVKLYLATLANSNFEEWYTKNPELSIEDFTFEFKKMSISIALFDLEKLNNISKLYFSRQKATDLYENALEYNKEFDKDFADLMEKYKDYTINVLNIERNTKKPRKDIGTYKDVKTTNYYMYDEIFSNMSDEDLYKDLDSEKTYDTQILKEYIEKYFDENDERDAWFDKLKSLAEANGYSGDTKAYKAEPEKFKGHVGDICELIRVAATSKTKTPDLYDLLKLLGKERLAARFERFEKVAK